MVTWIVILALLWPAFWLFRLLLIAKILLGLEFRREKITSHGPDGISAHLREAAQPCITELEALGFQLLGGWRSEHPEQARDQFAVVLALPDAPIRAVLRTRGEAERSGECWISLRTTTAQGEEIITASYSLEELIPSPPGILCETIPDASAATLLERHQSRISSEAANAWQCTDIVGAAVREQSLHDGVIEHFRASAWACERFPGVLTMRAGAALRQAARLLRRAARQKKHDQSIRRVAGPGLSAASQLAIDLEQYQHIGAVMNGRMPLRAKAILGAVSFLAFAAVLAWLYSPVVAVTLIIALVIHEGGHLLGMWWFGFRDTQLLFIPFFGGAAIGNDEKVLSPWKHVVIILLGPLPGLITGMVALASGVGEGSEWATQAAFTAVFLNAFNLLPIMPLDGGQIVDFAFASRYPRVRVLFLAASALGLAAIAFWVDGVQLLAIAAGAMLLRLPTEWRLSRLRGEVRAEYPYGGDEDVIVRRLLTAMRQPEWSKVPAVQRLQHVRGLQLVLRTPRAGFGTVCFALAGYTAPLWVGGPLALWAMRQKSSEVLAVVEQRVQEAGLNHQYRDVTPSSVPDEKNAAVLYARAVKLAEEPTPSDADVVQLLRAAAAKPVFEWRAELSPMSPDIRDTYRRGLEARRLLTAAEDRLKFREPELAAELTLDAWRLARHFDSKPGWWTWQNHHLITSSCLEVAEQVFAASAMPPAHFLTELDHLIDEEHEIAFAVTALPRDALEQAEMMTKNFDNFGQNGERLNWIWAMQMLLSDPARARADMLERAITLDRQLKEIRAGKWPVFEPDSMDGVQYQLSQLADLLARQRQAKLALQIAQRRKLGVSVNSLVDLKLDETRFAHPLTRQSVQWERRGKVEVITFGETPPEAKSRWLGVQELIWRLPASE